MKNRSATSVNITSSQQHQDNLSTATMKKVPYPGHKPTDRFRSIPPFGRVLLLVGSIFIFMGIFYLAFVNHTDRTKSVKHGLQTRKGETPLEHMFLNQCRGGLLGETFKTLTPKKEQQDEKSPYEPGKFCEGYWAISVKQEQQEEEHFNKNKNKDGLPPLKLPKARSKKFCGQDLFVKMLKKIEIAAPLGPVANDGSSSSVGTLMKVRSRGLSPSRLEKDKLLGNEEYVDIGASSVCWTGDLRPYYIEQFNVAPSMEFVSYVVARFGQLYPQKE